MSGACIELEAIKQRLTLAKFEKEIEYLEKNDGPSERIQFLKKIVYTLQSHKNTQTTSGDMNCYFDKMEKLTFSKLWSKLPEFHKIKKINEYVDEHPEFGKSRKLLIDAVQKGLINTAKSIKYAKSKIISIPALGITSKGEYFLKSSK